LGDAAEMAMIELVDFNEIYSNNKKGTTTEKAKTTRRSRAKKPSAKATGEASAEETKGE